MHFTLFSFKESMTGKIGELSIGLKVALSKMSYHDTARSDLDRISVKFIPSIEFPLQIMTPLALEFSLVNG